MSEAKHTKGPWRAIYRGVDQGANWASRIPYAIERAVGNAVQPIADVCDQPEAEANANLLAAAPDLLAGLKEALKDLECSGYAFDHPFLVTLRGIIAKATGGAA